MDTVMNSDFTATWNVTDANGTACSNISDCFWNRTLSDDNYVTVSEDLAVKVYWALLLIPLPLVAVVGNALVILSVYKENNLKSATNYFIVSLAFADLLVAALVMPFGVYALVSVDWELGDTLCDFYVGLDVTCSTASIFNLVAISINRFIAATQPLKYSKHQNNKRVFLTITIVWVVSAATGLPMMLGLNTTPERVPKLCVFYNTDFIIFSSLSSFYIPCLIIFCLYYRIFRAIQERAKKAIGQKMPANNQQGRGKSLIIETSSSNLEETSDTGGAKPLLKQGQNIPSAKLLSPLIESDESSHMRISDNFDDDEEESPPTDKEECQMRSNTTVSGYANETAYNLGETEFNAVTQAGHKSSSSTPFFKVNAADKSNVETVCTTTESAEEKRKSKLVPHPKRRSKIRVKNAEGLERKATKTLAIVLGVFLICWVPFFTCNILEAVCIKLESDSCRPGNMLFNLTTWLGYINSCFNPFIYTIFNLKFRKAFKKLLFEPCK